MRKLAFVGLVAALHLSAADPRVGTWKLVAAQSSQEPPRSLTVTSQGDSVHVAISGNPAVEFTAKWDGRDYPVQNVRAFNQIVIRQISKSRAELTQKKDGVVVATIRDQVSDDGQELTAIAIQKGHNDETTVWERTGGIKDAKNPFVGQWTQDFGKTRLRQGLVLKIEPNGLDGVRYLGEFRYDAKFDGKDYTLTNSRDDTVALRLVDAHTVESIYKRGEQISGQDRWVVASNGNQLTVTTTATLEAGERIHEELVFRKQ